MWVLAGYKGCMDQVIAVRQVPETHRANWKDVFWAFMDLENVYDTIDRHDLLSDNFDSKQSMEAVDLPLISHPSQSLNTFAFTSS